jgi:hypothetical protein
MKHLLLRRRTRVIGLTLAVAIVVMLGGLGLYNGLRSHDTSNDDECTAAAHSSVVTVFYRPGTAADKVRDIEASTGATQRDNYPQKHAFSLLTSHSLQAQVIATLHGYPEVTDVQVSAAQGCIDPN